MHTVATRWCKREAGRKYSSLLKSAHCVAMAMQKSPLSSKEQQTSRLDKGCGSQNKLDRRYC